MRKSYLKHGLLTLILMSFTVFYSCNKVKEAQQAASADPQAAKDYVTASSTFLDVFKKVDDAIQSQKLLKSKSLETDSCPKIVLSAGNYPKIVKIIFDTINSCTSENVTYKGTIIVQVTGPLTTTGSVENISFKNFSVNGNNVTGQGILTTTGTNSNGNLQFTFQVVNGTVTTTNGTITFATTQYWTWTEGQSTLWPDVADDEYQISGSASGKGSDGHNFTASITTPFTISMGCQYKFLSGQVQITPDTGPSMIIDFGSGTCSGQAIIEISGLPNVTVNL